MFRLVVFEEGGSGEHKISGIRAHGKGIVIEKVVDLPGVFPEVIDEPEVFIPEDFQGDLVLSFLRHPDLAEHLVRVCNRKGIPVIAAGRHISGAITPFTCCGLGHRRDCGLYGEQFGVPEYGVEVRDGRIASLEVRRGASCGATWQVVTRMIGVPVKDAVSTMGREVQYLCMADPSAFDPVSGKSALHYAGEVHMAALRKALAAATRS